MTYSKIMRGEFEDAIQLSNTSYRGEDADWDEDVNVSWEWEDGKITCIEVYSRRYGELTTYLKDEEESRLYKRADSIANQQNYIEGEKWS